MRVRPRELASRTALSDRKSLFASNGFAVLGTAALCALLLYLLEPLPLQRPEFWAEDGELFVQATAQGLGSLLTPVGGTLHLLGRLVAWASTWPPVAYAPHVFAGFSFALFALVHGFFAHSLFERLLPGRIWRVAFAAVFTAGAGTAEVAYNLANYPTLLAFGGFLLLVYADERLSWTTAAALGLVFLSSPSTVVLLPCVGLLCVRHFRAGNRPPAVLVAVLFAGAHAANALLTHAFAQQPYHVGQQPLWAPSNVGLMPLIYLEQLFARTFVLPFVGSGASRVLLKSPALVFWPVVLAVCAVTVWWTRRAKPNASPAQLQLLLAVLSAPVLFALVAVTRNYHPAMIDQLRRSGAEPFWNGRYAFLIARLAPLLFLALAAATLRTGRARTAAVAALMAVFALANATSFRRNLRTDVNWPATARAIEAGDPACRIVLQPLTPTPWKVIDCPKR